VAYITADYLDGDPDFPEPLQDGQLHVVAGAVRFVRFTFRDMLQQEEPGPALVADDVRAMEVADQPIRRTGLGKAYLRAGGIGMAHHQMTTAQRNKVLMVAGERAGSSLILRFAVKDEEGRDLLAQVQAGRVNRGQPALPPVREPSPSPTESAGESPSERDPIELIRRLAELRDAGLVTEGEFTTQKARLLAEL
jgi:hypothetical protein